MKTRTKVCAASILVGVVVLLVAATFAVRRAHSGTQIEGRPLTAWVRDLGDDRKLQDSRAALVRQGPVIIPDLLRSIAETEQLPARLQDKLAGTRLGKRLNIEHYNREMIRSWLFPVIAEIGAGAKHSRVWENEMRMAVDALLVEMKNYPQRRDFIAHALGHFGEHAKTALPRLIPILETNYPRPEVLFALAEIGPDAYAPRVVTVATNFISSTNDIMRLAAIQAIGACGSNAVAAVPQLLPLLGRVHMTDGNAALFALAQIGSIPSDVQPKIEQLIDLSNEAHSANAALALLRIDTNATTARAIVTSRLHPLVGTNLHMEMVVKVARIPEIAQLFEPELAKLAAKTNVPTSEIARVALKKISRMN